MAFKANILALSAIDAGLARIIMANVFMLIFAHSFGFVVDYLINIEQRSIDSFSLRVREV